MRLAALLLALFFFIAVPLEAAAIERSDAVDRGQSWVDAQVYYSQSKYYDGYRRDCSGFVSMCWDTGKSYTTRTIHEVSDEVPIDDLRKGDAVLTPGHVVLFVEWVDEGESFIALEESTWGRPALRRERDITRSSKAMRYDNIEVDMTPAFKKLVMMEYMM